MEISTPIQELCDLCKFKHCICHPSWNIFDTASKKYKIVDGEFEISPFIITTITLNFEVSHHIDLELLSTKQIDNIKSISFRKGSKKSKDEDINNNFYNQCNLELDLGKYSVLKKDKDRFIFKKKETFLKVKSSIFCNGKVKVVGCREVSHIIRAIHIIYEMFVKYPDTLIMKDSQEQVDDRKIIKKISTELFRKRIKNNFRILNVKIPLINATFYMDTKINRHQLYLFLKSEKYDEVRDVIFDTEQYEGVRIKYSNNSEGKEITTRKKTIKKEGEITIMVFNTGSIILTGGSNILDIISAYKFISELIQNFSFLRDV